MGDEATQGRARQGAAPAARERRDVRRAGRSRQQPAVAPRSVSAADRPGGMDRDRARRDAARAAAERAARRSLRRAARAQRKDRSRRVSCSATPQFLRPCTSVSVRDNLHLHFVAFDLARSADGRWWVLSDRTQAPSGAGYALENRVVSSQCLPELFADRNVRRLASFFRSFSQRFLSLANRDTPLAVFLSPGQATQNYFEHAYLARYLGFSVVEGSDLTVRDDRVYLKTVEGLEARRLDHAPNQRRALRSARAAHGFARRSAGAAAGGARRQGDDRQRARAAASSRATRS